MQVKKNLKKLDTNIDVTLAKLGIPVGIIGAILSALGGKNVIILGISISLISLSYLYIKRKKPEKTTTASNSVLYILLILFFFLISSSLLIFHYSEPYTIPISFYIIISALYAIIAAEIFFINNESKIKYLPLLQIFIVSLLFRLAVYYQFPSIGGINPWANYSMINDMISNGHLLPEYTYSNFPVFPLENIISKLITGLEYKECLFLTTGIIELLSVIFVFLLGKSICNFKTGVLAALFISFFSFHIGYGTHSIIAMSIGITFFSLISYLIIKNYTKNSIKISILIIFFLFVVILTHTIASTVCLLLLFLLLIGKYIYKLFENKPINEQAVTFTIASLFGVSLIGYWMWTSGYIGYIAKSAQYAFQAAREEYNPGGPGYVRSYNFYQYLFEDIGNHIIILLLILAIFIWLSKKNRTLERYSLLSFSGGIYLIIYLSNISGFDAILPGRWPPFLYIFLSIFICFGLIKISKKLRKSGKIITTSIIFVLGFTMIISIPANVDAPLYTSTARMALTESEMNSIEFIDHESNAMIHTDRYNSLYFKFILDTPENEVDIYDMSYFGNKTTKTKGLFMIRDYTLKNYFYVITSKHKKEVGYSLCGLIEGDTFNMRIFNKSNKIYDCNSVCMYKN